MTPWRRHYHRARWWAFRLLATFAIVMAVVIALTQMAIMPWLANHPEWIAAKLGEAMHRPVTIDKIDTQWERTGPLLKLTGVHLGAVAGAPQSATAPSTLSVASAGIKINFFAWARRNAGWTEFRLSGIELDLVRDADGHWQAPRGMESGGAGDDEQNLDDNALYSLGSLVLRDVRLNISDVPNDRHFKLAADELRLVNKGDLHRVLARVRNLETNGSGPSAAVDVVIEYNSGDRAGRAYVGGASIDLAAVLRNYPLKGLVVEHGGGKLQAWAWFAGGELSQVRIEVGLADLVLTTQTAIGLDPTREFLPHIGIERLAFGARWQRESDGWSADVADLALTRQGFAAAPAQFHLRRKNAADDGAPEYQGEMAALDLGTLASTAMLTEAAPAGLRRWLYAANPEGELRHAALRYVAADNYAVDATLEALAWHGVDKLPGVNGLSGTLLADQDALNFDLPQHARFALSLPKVFRQALEFSEFAGSIAAYRDAGAWRIETDALQFEGATPGSGFGGELRGAVDIPGDGSKPALDLYVLLTHGDVPASHLFWPTNIMSPNAVAWLDRALDAGRIVGGRAVFRGNLADWPFRNNAGRFDAHAEVADLRFKYLGDWPALEHGHATIDFVNAGLAADIDAASLQGNRISKAGVAISDYGEGTLEVTANAQGAGRDLLGFVKATPLGTRFAAPLEGVEVGGQAKVDFALHAPMKPIENFTIDGSAQLANADLADTKYNLHFDDASGPLRFNRTGFAADQLATTFKGKPAKFSLAVGGYVADAQHVVEVRVATHLPVRDVLAYAPALNDYQKYTGGEADWNALFSVDRDAKEGSGQRLVVTSDLRGATLDLPLPLAKPAERAVPLTLVLGLPFGGADIDLHLGDIANLRGRLPTPTAAFAANVEFGGEAASALPKSGLSIGGSARAIDLSGWMDFAADGSGGGGEEVLQRVEVRTAQLSAWDREFGAGEVKLAATPEAINLGIAGANIDGSFSVPRRDLRTRGISVDLHRLYWPATPEPEPGAPVPDDAVNAALNPAAIPPLHIRIGDFRLGKANYGAATMESVPIADGMHFDQVTTHSRSIDMRARGDWTRRGGYHRSTFGIDLTAQDFGAMLDALGYGGKLAGGAIVARIDASWAGAPSAFAISKINGGALKLNIVDGRIPDLETGAGRLAGLLNLAALPRRLAFDFGDLFNKGFSFDSAVGTFTLTDGYAYTENFEVKSPTADMLLKGSIGLKTSDWNQSVEVTPHVGGTLLIGGGALIGGPVGAAAGLVAQTLFKKQINAASQFEYKVSGSWDKPSIVRVASRPAPKKPAAAPKAAGAATPAAG